MMKAGLLILLVLIGVRAGNAPQPENTIVDGCADMVCFAPLSCKLGGTDNSLAAVTQLETITPDCKIIIKIRRYSISKSLFVLESRDSTVKTITVTKSSAPTTPLFVCEKGSDPKFKDQAPSKIVRNEDDPTLLCEFFAEEADGIETFVYAAGAKVEIVAEGIGKFKSTATENTLITDIHCDPAKALYTPETAPEGSSYEEFERRPADITCALNYHLMTKTNSDTKFMETTSAKCEKDDDDFDRYKYTVKGMGDRLVKVDPADTFSARCVVKDCELCEMPKNVEGTLPKIETIDGCRVLQCTSPGRINVGSEVKRVAATCQKDGDEFVWKFGTEKLDSSATVTCLDPKKCPDVGSLCRGQSPCQVGTDGVPFCEGENVVMHGDVRANITCNDEKGKYEYVGTKTIQILGEEDVLSCGKPGAAQKQIPPAPASIWKEPAYYVIFFGLIILILLGIIAFLYCKREQKKAREMQSSMKSGAPANSKSKEAASSKPAVVAGSSSTTAGTPSPLPPTATPATTVTPAAATTATPVTAATPAETATPAEVTATPAETTATPAADELKLPPKAVVDAVLDAIQAAGGFKEPVEAIPTESGIAVDTPSYHKEDGMSPSEKKDEAKFLGHKFKRDLRQAAETKARKDRLERGIKEDESNKRFRDENTGGASTGGATENLYNKFEFKEKKIPEPAEDKTQQATKKKK